MMDGNLNTIEALVDQVSDVVLDALYAKYEPWIAERRHRQWRETLSKAINEIWRQARVSTSLGEETSEWMTHREAAAYLRTTEMALHVAYCKRKKHLPPRYRFGRRLLYKRVEVEACIKAVDQ